MGMFPGDPGYSENPRREAFTGKARHYNAVHVGAFITRMRAVIRGGLGDYEVMDTALEMLEQLRLRLDQDERDLDAEMDASLGGKRFEDLTDRELSNVLHGRHRHDNGEFTASSMGAANDALRRVTKGILRDGTEGTETHHRADATAEDYPAASADGVQEAPQPAGSRPGGPGGPRGAFAGENRTRPPALETRPSSPRVYVADDIERSLRAHEMRLATLWVVGIVVAVTVYCLLTKQ